MKQHPPENTPPRVLVIGSSNTDVVIKASHFPQPGETLLGGEFFLFPGGKGANQAVAAARLGAQVTFVAKVGQDLFGTNAVEGYQKEGVDTSCVFTDSEQPSGVASILVNAQGQNQIVVAPGANHALSPSDINQVSSRLQAADLILVQLEIPLETVEQVIFLARTHGKRVILNPAPAQELPRLWYERLFLITPNQSETQLLTGIRVTDERSATKAAHDFKRLGVENVIITMGSQGVFVLSDSFIGMVEAPVVTAVDTTAAGDVFNGAVAVALGEGMDWAAACRFACQAAALSVTRMGAQSSAPYRRELTRGFASRSSV